MADPSASPALPAELTRRVEAWVAEDPDPATRAELVGLVAAGDEAGLRDRFDYPLSFGTAGLRGALGGGPGRMNRAVVRRTTAGLSRFLQGRAGDGPGPAGVVVGHDARHGSAQFADDAARVVAAMGQPAWKFASALPTPITAFAVRHLGVAAGVMVTASHNPAPDNGYKVYLEDGAQVVPPYDAAIAAAATGPVPAEAETASPAGGPPTPVDEDELLGAYRRAVLATVGDGGPRRLSTVYTPVHGVGAAVLPGLLEQAGFAPPGLVTAQARPDPDFPTAPYPNPEEPGVLDLALAQAEATGADLVLANDPDADRLAVAVPPRPGQPGPYRVLSGDELGALIGDHLLANSHGADRLVATTVVSSSMLGAMAARAGVAYAETLTGFKWIARVAERYPGYKLLFGYEEALGYAVTAAVADKDGLSAAVVVADMAARAKAGGRHLLDRWDELESELGVHATAQLSVRLAGADALRAMSALMARWRAAPPATVGGAKVSEVRDLAPGSAELPPSDVLIFQLSGTGRVVLRPSGTEPKLKAYLEATAPPCGPGDLAAARRQARERLARMRADVASWVGPR